MQSETMVARRLGDGGLELAPRHLERAPEHEVLEHLGVADDPAAAIAVGQEAARVDAHEAETTSTRTRPYTKSSRYAACSSVNPGVLVGPEMKTVSPPGGVKRSPSSDRTTSSAVFLSARASCVSHSSGGCLWLRRHTR